MDAEMESSWIHEGRGGFRVMSDDANYDIVLSVRYAKTATADEVLTALSQVYAKAFNEIDSRLGPVKAE